MSNKKKCLILIIYGIVLSLMALLCFSINSMANSNDDYYIIQDVETEYTYKYLLTKQRMDTVDQLFSETGKRNKKAELEFLQINITNLQRMADEYKLFVDTNRKTSFLSAVSLIMIITIVII